MQSSFRFNRCFPSTVTFPNGIEAVTVAEGRWSNDAAVQAVQEVTRTMRRSDIQALVQSGAEFRVIVDDGYSMVDGKKAATVFPGGTYRVRLDDDTDGRCGIIYRNLTPVSSSVMVGPDEESEPPEPAASSHS